MCVCHIEDPSAWYIRKELRCDLIDISLGDPSVAALKEEVAKRTGVPPQRQRYYGILEILWGGLNFDTEQILCGDGEGESVLATLHDLKTRGRIESERTIGIVLLPAVDAGSGDGDVNDVEIDRVVSAKRAHEKRTAAGRANAVEIADDSESDKDDDDGSGTPQPKRARRARNEAGAEVVKRKKRRNRRGAGRKGNNPAAATSGHGSSSSSSLAGGMARNEKALGENSATRAQYSVAGQDRSSSSSSAAEAHGADEEAEPVVEEGTGNDAASNNGNVNCQAAVAAGAGDGDRGNSSTSNTAETDGRQKEGVGEGQEADQIEEDDDETGNGTDAPRDAAAADAGTSGEAAAPAAEAPDAAGNAPQSLRQWLCGLDANGSKTGRFEAYAEAFEREFGSLGSLVLTSDNPKYGVESVLQACGVQRIGDRAEIEWAIGKLPRPE